jgi:hypothetical protein
MFLVASVLVPATAFAAGSGSLSANASTTAPTVGSTFTVAIDTTSAIATSGAAARLVFDQTKLQLVSVTKGADWNAGSNWVNFPTVAEISTANTTGTLPTVAVYLNSPGSVSAGTHTFLTATFFASAAGASAITLPVSASAGGLLDGQAASYGDPLTVTSTSANIVATGAGSAGSVVSNITGTVDSGFVGLTCPTSAVIPLVRNVTNTKDITCSVASNVTWQMSADDTNPDVATRGHMRDTAATPIKVLQDPMHVITTVGAAYDHDLSNLAQSNVVATGQNNVDINVTLSQFARPNDQAGNYGIQVMFAAVSVF